jgi:hypothetical protein
MRSIRLPPQTRSESSAPSTTDAAPTPPSLVQPGQVFIALNQKLTNDILIFHRYPFAFLAALTGRSARSMRTTDAWSARVIGSPNLKVLATMAISHGFARLRE